MAALCLTFSSRLAAAADPLTVLTKSGASYTGQLDPLTDERLLWLRAQRGRMQLRRPIDWNAIEQVQIGQRILTADELRADHARYAQPSQRTVRRLKPDETPTERVEILSPPKVTSLRMEAAVVNWDADVETDGIQLQLAPLGPSGELVPVSGTLEVELIGQGPANTFFPETFPVLARWVRQLSPGDLTQNGYAWQLDYQALHPEFNLRLGGSAMVHARLSVPGNGALEISSPTINVRPINPVRDQLQMQGTGRFFPQEQTGLGKRPQ